MDKLEPSNRRSDLYKVIKPLNFIWQAFGLCPMVFDSQKKLNRKRYKKFSSSLSLMWITVMVSWSVMYIILYFWSLNGTGTYTQTTVLLLSSILSSMSAVTSWISNISNGFDRCILMARQLPKTNFLMHDADSHNRKTRIIVVTMFIFTLKMNILGFLCPLWYKPFMHQLLVFMLCLAGYINTLDSVQYCWVLWELRARLTALNRRILESTCTKSRCVASTAHASGIYQDFCFKTRKLRRAHHYVLEISAQMDTHFGWSQLLGVARSFVGILLSAHELMTSITSDDGENTTLPHTTVSIIWLITEATRIAFLCIACSSVVVQYHHTSRILVSTMLERRPGDRCQEEDAFLAQVTTWRPKLSFTAAGFFKIDMTLLFSVLGATATYIIVIAQVVLRKSDNST